MGFICILGCFQSKIHLPLSTGRFFGFFIVGLQWLRVLSVVSEFVFGVAEFYGVLGWAAASALGYSGLLWNVGV